METPDGLLKQMTATFALMCELGDRERELWRLRKQTTSPDKLDEIDKEVKALREQWLQNSDLFGDEIASLRSLLENYPPAPQA
jgi:uncharacterized protein YydD (DUF2326 family)